MKPFLISLTVFFSLAFLTQYLAYQRYVISVEAEQHKVLREISSVKDRLKTCLSYSLSATKTLAFIVTEYGEPDNFDKIAAEILGTNKYVDALELTKKGIITHVYPLKGNEAAIGLNVLLDSIRSKEAYRAIERKELYFAGPFELKQGGTAIVGRLPIFIGNEFYGFSVVLIKLSTLVKNARLDGSLNNDFEYQLSKINPNTLQEEFFLSQKNPVKKDTFASIDIPDGEWKLYVIPKHSDTLPFHVVIFSLLGLVLSITSALFAGYLTRQPERLRLLVKDKTSQLAASEKYFRSLIEKSSDAIVLLNKEGQVIYQSISTERITGYTLQDMQALDRMALIHPDDKENAAALFAQLAGLPGTVIQTGNHRFRHKQGHYIWLEGTYSNLLNDKDVYAIVYNYHDITHRIAYEEKIAQIYRENETTLNRISDSVVSVDNQWRYTFLNDAALTTHPAGRTATLGKVIWDVHPEMRETIFWDKYHEAMRTQKVIEIESHYTAMNTWFSAKAYPSPNGLTIFYNDITIRKLAEERVANEKLLSEYIINSLPGIFYLYNNQGKFLRWNKNFEVVSGYTTDEIGVMHPLDFFCDDEKQELEQKIAAVFSTGRAEVTAHFYTRSKKKLPYYFTGRKVTFNGTDYLIGMGIDVTTLVETEKELRARTQEIEQLTTHMEGVREEERTRIAREIHDELGQQLTGLKMDAFWITKRIIKEDAPVHEKLATMISLIDDTIKTVRRIASELRPGILDDLGLVPALEWQSQEFQKRTGIQSEFITRMADFFPEKTVATHIFRIFQEALTNVARHANATHVHTTLTKKDGFITLVVTDNGDGFDLTHVKTKNSLGLVGMKERARMFAGELSIERNRPRGTTVKVKIPSLTPSTKNF